MTTAQATRITPETIRTASLYPLATLEARTAGTARVLVTRYWPRGVKRERIDDWWGPRLAPTAQTLKAYKAGAMTWETFAAAYWAQVILEIPILRLQTQTLIQWHGAITLLCHERCPRDGHDESDIHCHRRLLRDLLLEN
jgi:uncharacterized protein YeaO (DUF488 family)